MLRINNLSVGYKIKKNKKIIISNINLDISGYKLITIIGKNGAGKSTLIKTLVGLLPAISGDIFINNKNIKELSHKQMAKQISFVSGRLIEQNNTKVYDLIALGRLPYTNWIGFLKKQDKQVVDKIINLLNINKLVSKKFNNLSDGEKQKVLIARALSQDTKIVILDEPASHLDLSSKYELSVLLKNISISEKKMIIFSGHDISSAFYSADLVWLINNGKLIESGPVELKNNPNFKDLFVSNLIKKADSEKIIQNIYYK